MSTYNIIGLLENYVNCVQFWLEKKCLIWAMCVNRDACRFDQNVCSSFYSRLLMQTETDQTTCIYVQAELSLLHLHMPALCWPSSCLLVI